MTYGQIKFRLTKAFPGVDADLIEGWILDTHAEILGMLPWTRLYVQSVLTTTAPYSTGTVSVQNGSSAITLTGGAWTGSMNGLEFRVTGDSDVYQFTQTGDSTGVLDRPYAGTTNASAGYAIYQSVYPMPANCRHLDDDSFAGMSRLATQEGQNALAAGMAPDVAADSPQTGRPVAWWPYMDDASIPPQLQVRVFPVPDKVYAIPCSYIAEAAAPGATSFTLLPWLQPAALIEGATAKISKHLKDTGGYQAAKAEFKDAMRVMITQEANRVGSIQLRLGGHYTRGR